MSIQSTDEELLRLRAEVAELRAAVARMHHAPVAAPASTERRSTRRQAMARLGAAVVGVAALGAGNALTTSPVGATDGSALIVGQTNTSASSTILSSTVSGSSGVLQVTGTISEAIRGTGPGNHSGVFGISGADGKGVLGELVATATTGAGVLGVSPSASFGTSIALNPQTGGDYGVYGYSKTGNGVYGNSVQDTGVYGVSGGGGAAPFGVVGAVSSAPGFALYGVASVANTVGFAAGAAVAGAIAGQFAGNVNFFGGGGSVGNTVTLNGTNLVVANGGTKTAAMLLPDGTYGLLHSIEAPEAWFEDFGEAQLVAGKAEVQLDPNFHATVDTSTMHVFLTPHDETHHLAVKARAGDRFTVAAGVAGDAAIRGAKASDLHGAFTYRVVARRKDVKPGRFTHFDVPKEIKLSPPPLPKPA